MYAVSDWIGRSPVLLSPGEPDVEEATLTADPEISRDVIAARAYEIYLERGREHGHDWDDWLQAEYELRQLPVRELIKLVDAMPRREKPQTKSLLEVVRLAMIDERRTPRSRDLNRPVAASGAASPNTLL